MPSRLIMIAALLAFAAPAQAATCRVLGEKDTLKPLYGKPAGPSTGSIKAGTMVTTMGGGHDPSGKTWLLVGRGATRGWIERTNLACTI